MAEPRSIFHPEPHYEEYFQERRSSETGSRPESCQASSFMQQHRGDHWELQLQFWNSQAFLFEFLNEYVTRLESVHIAFRHQEKFRPLELEKLLKDRSEILDRATAVPEASPMLALETKFTKEFVCSNREQLKVLKHHSGRIDELLQQFGGTDFPSGKCSDGEEFLRARKEVSSGLTKAYDWRKHLQEALEQAGPSALAKEAEPRAVRLPGLNLRVLATCDETEPEKLDTANKLEDCLLACYSRGPEDLQSISLQVEPGADTANVIIHLGRDYRSAEEEGVQGLAASILNVPRDSVQVMDRQPGSLMILVRVAISILLSGAEVGALGNAVGGAVGGALGAGVCGLAAGWGTNAVVAGSAAGGILGFAGVAVLGMYIGYQVIKHAFLVRTGTRIVLARAMPIPF